MTLFTVGSYIAFLVITQSKVGFRLLKKSQQREHAIPSSSSSIQSDKTRFLLGQRKRDQDLEAEDLESDVGRKPSVEMNKLHESSNQEEPLLSTEAERRTPAPVNESSQDTPEPFSALSSLEKRAIVVSMLCLLFSGFMTYVVTPGIQPFIVTGDNSPALLYVSNAFLIGNIVGRVFTLFFKTKYVWMPVLFQFLLTLWFFITAVVGSQSVLSWSQWAFVPAMVIFSAMNGYIGTNAYFFARSHH